jgi:hypothetical protein
MQLFIIILIAPKSLERFFSNHPMSLSGPHDTLTVLGFKSIEITIYKNRLIRQEALADGR